MNDGHIRLNPATREWVIYAPTRRNRPHHLHQQKPVPDDDQQSSLTCPFCNQSEQAGESILLELPRCELPSSEWPKSGKNWQTRVVSNKYPALTPTVDPKRSLTGLFMELPAHGHHEVVIESPDHYTHPAVMSLPEVSAIVETYRQRYKALIKMRNSLFVIIFRNHGPNAGASLQHPHSQIISTPIVPRRYRWREDEAQRYFDEWGRCAYCDMLELELSEKQRVISENDDFLAFIPYAAAVPFEIWILPKTHSADFGTITEAQVQTFAQILKASLEKLYVKLDNPDYNYAIMTAARYKAADPHLHWYCKIRPRLTQPAGFEMGSGISINPSLPEADAAFLNS